MLAALRQAEVDPRGALPALLEAWRAKRCARLADLIDRISKDAAADLPSLVKKPLAAQWAQWVAVAEQRKPEDFDRLVAVPMPRKWTDAEPLFAHLYRWEPDPRLARYLASVIATNAIHSRYGDTRADQVGGFYHRLMAVLAAHEDHRALPALEDARTTHGDPYSHWRNRRAEIAAQLRAVPVPAETPDEAALLDRLLAPPARTPQTAAELLARIHEAPDDLGARAVYGDLLSEQGDPRGELITLQLAHERNPAREQKLLKAHGAAWAGPIGGWFTPASRIFEGGFLAGGRLADGYRVVLDDAALAAPEWRLIRALDVPLGFDAAALFHPNLAGVRRLAITEVEVLALLKRSWPFEELVAGHWRETPMPSPHPLADAAAFPALKTLGVHDIPNAAAEAWRAWLPTAPVLKRLRCVVLEIFARELATWWRPMSDSPIPELQVGRRTDWVHTFSRDARGALGRLRCGFQYRPGSKPSTIAHGLFSLLDALPPDALTAIEIERTTTTRKLPREKLNAALARFPKLGEVALP